MEFSNSIKWRLARKAVFKALKSGRVSSPPALLLLLFTVSVIAFFSCSE